MAADTVPALDSHKFSRYRSMRRAQGLELQQSRAQTSPPAMPSPVKSQKDQQVSRSMSRYRQRPTASGANAQKPPPVPLAGALRQAGAEQLPQLPLNLPSPTHATSTPHMRTASIVAAPRPRTSHNDSGSQDPTKSPPSSRAPADPVPSVKQGVREPPPAARDEARQLIQEEAERQRRMQAKLRAEKQAKFEAEQAERERLDREAEEAERARAQKEAEQADRARLQKEAEAAERRERRSKAKEQREREHHESSRKLRKPPQLKEEPNGSRLKTPPEPSPNPHSSSKQGTKFSFLKRRKEDEFPKSPNNPANISKPRQVSNGNGPPVSNMLLGDNGPSASIKPGGGGVVPGIDAPISAVNAGDRVSLAP